MHANTNKLNELSRTVIGCSFTVLNTEVDPSVRTTGLGLLTGSATGPTS